MHVFCTSCGVQIPAADLNIETAMARCRACNAVFSFADALAQETVVRPARGEAECGAQRKADEIPLPNGVRVDDLGGVLRLRRRWFNVETVLLLFFCVTWDSFLVFWYSVALTHRDVPWIMIVFPAAFVAVGVGMTYSVLCGLFNRTVVEVGNGVFSIRHGPLPWRGNRTIPAAELEQLYCRRVAESRGSSTYELHALTTDGKKLKLLSGLSKPEDAWYFEQQIERCLGLKDRPVRGEWRR